MARVVSFIAGIVLGVSIVLVHSDDTGPVEYPNIDVVQPKD